MLDAGRVDRWVEDIGATTERVEAACVYYARELGFNELRAQVEDTEVSDEAALRAITDFFSEERVHALIGKEWDNFNSTPLHVSPFASLNDSFYRGVCVYTSTRAVSLLVVLDPYELAARKRRTPGDQRTMTFTGRYSSVKVVTGNFLRVRKWEIDPYDDTADLRGAPPAVRLLGEFDIRPGETLHLGPFQEVDFLKADGLVMVMLSNIVEAEAPMSLVVDVDTSAVLATTATSQAPTRLQMLATMLRLFDRQDAFDELRKLLSYDKHFVRWHGLREMLGLDAERALPDLIRMSESDPQPSVRRAAQATLARFFPQHATAPVSGAMELNHASGN
ncbi:MAG TPA: HEAT repeat domain-containing protein [Allosphingosinicella sp.]|nr:HEAT repeat domain-containing protein [Allosphingosinicella sp.]